MVVIVMNKRGGFGKQNKYRAIKTAYKGIRYDSKREAQYAMYLDSELNNKCIKSWERQVRIPLIVNDIKICVYILDFKVIHNDGSEELVEVKGYETDVWKLKKKLIEATYLRENKNVKYSIVK